LAETGDDEADHDDGHRRRRVEEREHQHPGADQGHPDCHEHLGPTLGTRRPPIGDITTSGMLNVRKMRPASSGF
jgi:hypothetical protein